MKTISLSQVDAPTLAEFEVRNPAVLSNCSACTHTTKRLAMLTSLSTPSLCSGRHNRSMKGVAPWFPGFGLVIQGTTSLYCFKKGIQRDRWLAIKLLCLVCNSHWSGVDSEKEAAVLAEEDEREAGGSAS